MRVAVAVVATVGIMACGGPAAPKEPIVIGVVFSQTGSFGASGTAHLQAAQLAAEEINAAGGVLGRPLKFEIRDNASDQAKAVDLANELVSDAGVKMLMGANPSAATLAVAEQITGPSSVVQISGASTSSALTAAKDNGFFFRTVPSDLFQQKLIAARAKAKGFTQVAVIDGPPDTAASNNFATAFTAGGGTVTDNLQYMLAQPSYTALLNQVYMKNPEAIVLNGAIVESVQIIKDYLACCSSKNTFWFFRPAQAQNDFLTGVGPTNFTFGHEGVASSLVPNNDRFPVFKSAFNAKYSTDPTTYGMTTTYDAVYLLALATQAAAKVDGTAIRDQMGPVSAGGMGYAPADLKKALEAAARGDDIDFQGVSGPVDLDMNGDVAGSFDIWSMASGMLKTVETDVPVPQ